jgi:hypothetical protein
MRRLFVVALLTMTSAAVARAQAPAPQLGEEYQRLGYLVGTWKGGGDMYATALSAVGKFAATITCTRFSGGFHVVCNVDGMMGGEPYREMAVFGFDPEAKQYTWYDIDSTGMNAFCRGSVQGPTWTFVFDVKAGGKPAKLRVFITELSPTSFENRAEVSLGGGPWALMQLVKMSKLN